MVTDPRTGTEVLDRSACLRLLAQEEVGRLAFVVAGGIEIFPINFVLDGEDIVFRTAEGTKLAGVVAAAAVAFEVDGYDADSHEAWSVVVKGVAELVENFDDIYKMEALPLFSWNVTPKQWFVRVRHNRITGRRFVAVRDHEPRD